MVRPPPRRPNRLNFGDSLDVMRGHISRLLFLIFLLLLTACTTPAPDPTVTSTSEPAPTQTATPTPTATAATPTLTPETTTTSQSLTVEEYAAACGEVMGQSEEIGVGEAGERDFVNWVETLSALDPPAELKEFHDARTGKYSAQLPDGPNSNSQAASDREIEIVAEMPVALRQMLIDEWCLLETSVLYGARVLAAKARMALPLERPVTVEDYAQRCSDIQTTAPTIGSLDSFFTHMITHWRELEPPPGAEAYHDALLKLYIEWHETGSADPAFVNVQAASAEAKKLGPDFVEQLYRGGCLRG